MNYALLAGGLKNLNSTSYINSTLQILLHFRPFVDHICSENPIKGNENYSLIICLQNLINKLKSTDKPVSTDPIISAMSIDPKLGKTIDDFVLIFNDLIPFNMIKFEIEECKTSIQDQILLNIQFSSDFQYDFSGNFLYVHIKPNNYNTFNVNQDISIFDFHFTLYAVVQVIISTTSHNHYFVTIRDETGWVRFNDTAVTEINQAQFLNSLHNLFTPIEILIFIKDIHDSEIIRRPASLQSKFTPIEYYENTSNNKIFDNNEFDHNSNFDNYGLESHNSSTNIQEIINDDYVNLSPIIQITNNDYLSDDKKENIQMKRNQSSDNDTSDEITELPSFNTQRPHNQKRKILLINSDPYQKRKQKYNDISDSTDDDDDDYHVIFFDASRMKFINKIGNFEIPNHIRKDQIRELRDRIDNIDSIQTKYSIENKAHFFSHSRKGQLYDTLSRHQSDEPDKVVIFELKNMPNFNIDEIRNCEICKISFLFFENRNYAPVPYFHGSFVVEQTYKDIMEYINIYMHQIGEYRYPNFSAYLYFEKRYYKVSFEKKIKDIKELINHSNRDAKRPIANKNIQFVIFKDKQLEKDIYSIQIPVYLIQPTFDKKMMFSDLFNIDDSCYQITSNFKKCYSTSYNPVIYQYIDEEHKIIPFDLRENILKLSLSKNVRLQQPQPRKDNVLFIYDNDYFLYEVRPNIPQNILANEIRRYLKLSRSVWFLFYNDNDDIVDFNCDIYEAFNQKLFSYVIVNIDEQ